MKLLLAEDEKELSNALAAILRHNNYSVDAVYDGENAYQYGLDESYDGLILDIMMPKTNGIEVLKKLRKNGITTPALFLTAKSELDDKIEGLDSGADDYLTKPFEMKELLARIRALTRRKTEIIPTIYRFGNICLNSVTYELSGKDGAIRLGNKEYQMMEMLTRNPGQLVATDVFMERIWGYDSDAEINVVWVYISYLRKKLASLGADVDIRTSRGRGYYLEAKNA